MRTTSGKTLTCVALVSALTLAACGDSTEGIDLEEACRVGQRLVDETAAADSDGAERQIDRLSGLDGIADSGLDVDDLEDISRDQDQQAVEDLVAEFEVLDCGLDMTDVEDVATAEPPATTPATPPPTDVPADTTPSTDAPVEQSTTTTEPEAETTEPAPVATDAPADTTPPAPAPPTDGTGISIDVGSSGGGATSGANLVTENVLADFGLENMLFSPDTNVIEFYVDRDDRSRNGDVKHNYSESITMTATTDTSIEDIRSSYRAALEAISPDFSYSESNSSDDNGESVGLSADQSSADIDTWSWDVFVGTDVDFPGVVIIEVQRLGGTASALPAIPTGAQASLQGNADIGADLGWTLTGYDFRVSQALFDGSAFESGRLMWNVSEDNTVAAAGTAAQAVFGEPVVDLEETEDSVKWSVDVEPRVRVSITYDDAIGTNVFFSV